jgi:cytoskeletal protein CcmA (bactofilin family)
MPYNITLTNGNTFAVIPDGAINARSTMILIGQNYVGGYGEFQNENFIHLLENSADSSPPAAPLVGQLWFDSANKILKVYNGTEFSPVNQSTGNIVTTNIFASGYISAAGNISGEYIKGNGAYLTNVTASTVGVIPNLTVTGTVTTANLIVHSDVSVTGTTYGNTINSNIIETITLLASETITAGNFNTDGNLTALGNISIQGNVAAQYFTGNGRYITNVIAEDIGIIPGLTATGNIYAGNISASGNIHSSYYLGNGSQLTGITTILNGSSNVVTSPSAVTVSANSVNDVATFTSTGLSIIGTVQVSNAFQTSALTILGNLISSNDQVITIDPNGTSGNGVVIITGNLQVEGTTTTINSNTITTNDLFINVANNAATSSAANNGGLGVGPDGSEYARLYYNSVSNTWNLTNTVSVAGNVIVSNNIISAGNTSASGTVSDNNGSVRSFPMFNKTAAYELSATDIGGVVNITTGGITVPSGIFLAGNAITIFNNSGSDQTITPSGVTMYNAGTSSTGVRTLAQYGVATVLCVGTDTFVISGSGLS